MEIVSFTSSDLWQRIIVSITCGALVGLDRQLRGKTVGIRTCSLISLGTTIFVMLGSSYAPSQSDPLRVLAQVVSGIGFLGAGVIMSREGLVTGVTTAAVIWVLATIGATVGMGYYGMALAVTIATLGILIGVEWLEETFQRLRIGSHRRKDDLYEPPEE